MQIDLLYKPSQTLGRCLLGPGETIMAESGAMVGFSDGVSMRTHAGSAFGAIGRMFGGESIFRNDFTAGPLGGEVLVAPSLRGDLIELPVGPTHWKLRHGAFVASSAGVDVATEGSLRGMFSGAGLFLLTTRGAGQLLVGSFGALEEVHVDGEFIVDTGHIVAWETSLDYSIGKAASGWIASFLSGEGLVCEFRGRGRLFMQTRNPEEYGSTVGRLLPSREE
jgi:uncharacterized protein (TIGR00266 family)